MTTLDGHALLALSLVAPRTGAWTADVEVDTDTALAGVVTLDLDGRAWRATIVRGAVAYGRWVGRLVGAGGLQAPLPPLALASTTLRGVLDEALRESGEALAPTAGDLSAAVARWHRTAATGLQEVAEVARAAGMTWRVRPDATVWVGAESWPAVTLGAELDVLDRDPVLGRYELAGDAALDIVPGTVVTLDGSAVRVGAVTHRLEGVALLTSVLEEREEPAPTTASRLWEALSGIILRVTRRFDRTGNYAATVVQQNSDGSLDLQPEDPRRPSCQRVPYRTLPGLTVEIPAGSRVAFTYEDGDPRRPVVTLWEPSTVAGEWTVNGSTRRLARTDDTTANGKLVFSPTGSFVGYVAPGGVDVPTPPGGSIATLVGTITGSSIIRG